MHRENPEECGGVRGDRNAGDCDGATGQHHR
jgi:hypothetical protein